MTQSVPREPIISVDDHIVEPPNLWLDRLPEKYHDVGPRVEREKGRLVLDDGINYHYEQDPDGRVCDVWRYEDMDSAMLRIVAHAGCDPSDEGLYAITYDEMRPGYFEQKPRLEDMDTNGVEASICFPNFFVRFCGQRFLDAEDKELALLCVQAYNDWMIEEWAGGSGGRLVPVCIVPLWDPELAADEVRRVAALGNKVITFSELPTLLDLPSIYTSHWDPLFRACEDTGTVISMHIGSGSVMPTTSADAPPIVAPVLEFMNTVKGLTDWLVSGKLVEFSDLKINFAECQIGWLPYVLQTMDTVWKEYGSWGWGDRHGHDVVPEPPSHYFREHVLCAFFDDAYGVESLDHIGVKNVAFESDYPHAGGSWPNTMDMVDEMREKLSAATVKQITRQNAIDFFNLDLSS